MTLIYQTIDLFEFEQIKAILESNGISFRCRNTVVSMYNNFGTYEVYVSSNQLKNAQELIKNVFK